MSGIDSDNYFFFYNYFFVEEKDQQFKFFFSFLLTVYGTYYRTPEEFSAGHVVGAVNIPYMYRVGSGYFPFLECTEHPNFIQISI